MSMAGLRAFGLLFALIGYFALMYWLSEVAEKDMQRRGQTGWAVGSFLLWTSAWWPVWLLARWAARRRYPVLETKKSRGGQGSAEAGVPSSPPSTLPEEALRELERKAVNAFDRLRGLEARAAREAPHLSPSARANVEEALAVQRADVDGYLRMYLKDVRPRGPHASHLDELVILRQRSGADLPVS